MHTGSRVRRGMSAAAVSLALVATVLIPIGGVASAATTSTTCPPGEGGPNCVLVISGPESVLTGVPFTVQVLVTTDGTTVAKSDPCASKVAVNLDVTNSIEGGPSGIFLTANASAGIATFSVTIPAGSANDGLYSLYAHVGGGDLAPATDCGSYFYETDFRQITAVTVPDTQPIAPCPDNTVCVQTASGGGTAATLISDDGEFTGVLFGGETVDMTTACGGPPLDSNGVLTFHNTTATGPKTIIFALASNLVNKGIGQFNVCWSGYLANGTAFTGLLPACGKNATGPCVLFKRSNQKNVGFFGVLAPPGTFDPKGYPK